MKGNVQLSVYSPFGKKLCELYNSACQFSGQASDLSIKKTIGEIHTLTFSLPTVIENEDGALVDNFRWEFIKNENLVYVTMDDVTDVYRIKTPEDTVSGKQHSMTVTCLHRSENLKSRNLTQTYDAMTANAEDHMRMALEGTGWGIGQIDIFNEEEIFEKQFHLVEGFVRTPSDMSFGAYAEIKDLTGHSAWDANKGWLSASPRVVSIGKNLFDGLLVLGHLDTANGSPIYVNNALRYRPINYIYVKPFRGETLTISGAGFESGELLWFDANKTLQSVHSGRLQAQIPATATWMKFMLWANFAGDAEFTTAPSNVQVEIGQATAYEKYKTPFTVEISDLGAYDTVDRTVIRRATGYNEANHTTYETAPTEVKFSPAAVKLYENGIIYLENLGVGTVSCNVVYSVDNPEGAVPKEMVRSHGKESGTGALDNLKAIAELFGGNLVFDGYEKTVGLVKIIGANRNVCFRIGKNMKSFKRTRNTTDFITRLYVIDQTTESGYIGIEDVNPLGTSFILDFDYFKEAGMLSQEQISAIDTYKSTITGIAKEYRSEINELYLRQNTVNGLVGQAPFAFASAANASSTNIVIGPKTAYNGADEPACGDTLYVKTSYNTWQDLSVIAFNASTRTVTLSGAPVSCVAALWTKKHPAGTIGARLVEIKTKRDLITTLQAKFDDSTDAEEKAKLLSQINNLYTDLDVLHNGTADSAGLFSLLSSLMLETIALNATQARIEELNTVYMDAGDAFNMVMGDAISDGIFPQGDYAEGQELALYADAVKYLRDASRPKVEYTVDGNELGKVPGYENERIGYGDVVYISEDRLGIQNLEATVTTYVDTPLSNKLNTFNVGNYKESTKWMEDIVSATKKIKERSKIYDRAQSIEPNGLINPDVLTDSLNENNIGSNLDLTNNAALQDVLTNEEASALLGYRVETVATYTTLTDVVRSVVVKARVYHGNEDVTYLIPAENFVWVRTSPDTAGDAIWNADPAHIGVKSITLNTGDVKHVAHIACNVTIPE